MRQPSHSLFRFIKKMTPSEKRYFKRLGLSNQKEANQYVLLFDAINNQDEYDEQALLKQFAGYGFINNFSEIKKYLYQQLQKGLRLYHAQNSIDIVLYNYLSDIVIFYHKELYSECEQMIKKTKKLATKHEKYNILLLLNEWKRNVVRINHHSSNIRDYLNEEVPLDQEYIKHVQNESDYFNVGLEVMLIAREQGLAEVSNLQLKTPSLPPMSFRAKRYLFWKHAQIGSLEQDFEKAYSANTNDVLLFEQNPHFISAMPKLYVVALSNVLTSCEEGKYNKYFDSYMQKTLKVLNKYPFNPEFKLKEELFVYIVRSSVYNQRANIEDILSAAQGLKEHFLLVEKKGYIDSSLTLYVNYELLNSAVICNDFEKGLEYYNDIQQLSPKNNREIFQLNNRLLGIMLHYHFENWLFLESLIRSTSRIIRLKFDHDSLAKSYVEVMKKCIAIRVSINTDDQQVIEVLKKFKQKIDAIPLKLIGLRYVLIAWFDSIIFGKSLAECIPNVVKFD